MAIFRLAAGPKNAMAAAMITELDNVTNPWYAEVYSGTIPASVTDAIGAQVKLGTVTGAADPSATQTGGLITFGAVTGDSAADASGTATWMRIKKGDGSTWADLDIGDLASSCTAKMNTANIVVGGPITVNSFTLQVG